MASFFRFFQLNTSAIDVIRRFIGKIFYITDLFPLKEFYISYFCIVYMSHFCVALLVSYIVTKKIYILTCFSTKNAISANISLTSKRDFSNFKTSLCLLFISDNCCLAILLSSKIYI